VCRERERERGRETEKERERARERDIYLYIEERAREKGGRACACLIESGGRETTWGFSRDFDAESVENSVGLDSSWQWHLPHPKNTRRDDSRHQIGHTPLPAPLHSHTLPPARTRVLTLPGGRNENRAGCGKDSGFIANKEIKIF
jgi:hypothetical protein